MASDKEAANALKLQGNKAFADHDWPTAVDFYSQAIEKYDQEPSFFCNRAQVRPTSPQIYTWIPANAHSFFPLGRPKSNSRLLDTLSPTPPRRWNWTQTTSRLVATEKYPDKGIVGRRMQVRGSVLISVLF
jgi:hypothetical protein